MSPARIGLIGGECTGKTTTATDLAGRFAAAVTPEALRDFVIRHGRTPRAEEQRPIMREQRAREDALARRPDLDLVIGDPATAMTAIYSDAYFADASLLPEATSLALDYDLVLWCRPDIPWVADPGQRDGAEYRERVDDLLAAYIHVTMRPAGIVVLELTGDRRTRHLRAVEAIGTIIGGPSRAWQSVHGSDAT